MTPEGRTMRGITIVGLLFTFTLLLSFTGLPVPAALAQGATPAASCAAATPEETLAVVRRFYEEGVNGADLSVFDEVTAPDVVYHGATVSDESGLDTLKRIYGDALTGFPGIQYRYLSSVAGSGAVAIRYQAEGIHNGDFRGLPPTGNPVTWIHSAFAHVQCGRISEMWAEIDQLDRLQQLGLLVDEGPAAIMTGSAADRAATPIAPATGEECAPESPEALIALVDRVRAEVYNDGNLDAIPEIFAADYLHGSANGPDAVGFDEGARRIGTFVTAFPDLDWTFDEVIVQGNSVAARWTTRGTHDGDLLGFAATGKPVAFTGISHFTVNCGKITSFQTEMDAAGMLEQIGADVRRQDG
jgi:steroid delta-isomerase-like uncharacterized protein